MAARPDPTESLIALLDLEPIERNIYRGENRDIGSGRIFGGQVLAQALVAARRTIPDEDREAHSLHGYFILEGDLSIPVVYFVDRTRDGRSFTTRRVTAIQHGRAIFTLSASFHRTEPGLTHQSAMPPVAPPEGLPSELEILRDQADRIPEDLRTVLTQDRPLEFRPVERYVPFDRTRRPRSATSGSGRSSRWATTPLTTRPPSPMRPTTGSCRRRCSRTAARCATRI